MKYEEVYLHDYQTAAEAVAALGRYFAFYNHDRPDQAFGGLTRRMATSPLAAQRMDKEGEATRFAASSLALRPPSETGKQLETIHLIQPDAPPVDRGALNPIEKQWGKAKALVELVSLTADQEAFLKRLQEELVNGGLRERAPFKYRSLQLTGDEKRLESLLNTQLFGPERLSLELLNCDGLGLPLTYERFGSLPRMIIVENTGSFLVARRVLAEAKHAPYGLIAYGGGTQIFRCVDYLKEIDGLSGIDYVGDIDAKGIDIGAGFADRVGSRTGLAVTPATDVHMAMLGAAKELGHPNGWPTASGHRTSALHRWISRQYADNVEQIISSGCRVPEEVLHDGHYRDLWCSANRQSSDVSADM